MLVTPVKDSKESSPSLRSSVLEGFAPLPSNLDALELVAQFIQGQVSCAVITGPSGWGKSHLLKAAAHELGCQISGSLPGFALADRGVNPRQPLIYDNAQELFDKVKARVQVQLVLERRVRARRPTLLSFSDLSPKEVRNKLPMSSDWQIAELKRPSRPERTVIVRQMASNDCMQLSPAVVETLSRRMRGNGRTLRGALQRLMLEGRDWITNERTLAACGVLDPFLKDCATWDLAEIVFEAASNAVPEDADLRRSVAIYTTLQIAALPEESVARFYELCPARVYMESSGFKRRLRSCAIAREALEKVVLNSTLVISDT